MKFKVLEKYSQQEIFKMFYISGAIIFLIVGVANTFTNFTLWKNMLLSAKVSALFMNLFNYILSVFFFSLYRGQIQKLEPLKKEVVDEIFNKKVKEVKINA